MTNSFFAGLAVDAAFANADKAIYTPPGGGAPVPCRIIIKGGDEPMNYEGGSIQRPVRLIDVRKSDVAQPREGGMFQFVDLAGIPYGDEMKISSGVPRCEDAYRLIWTCPAP